MYGENNQKDVIIRNLYKTEIIGNEKIILLPGKE